MIKRAAARDVAGDTGYQDGTVRGERLDPVRLLPDEVVLVQLHEDGASHGGYPELARPVFEYVG